MGGGWLVVGRDQCAATSGASQQRRRAAWSSCHADRACARMQGCRWSRGATRKEDGAGKGSHRFRQWKLPRMGVQCEVPLIMQEGALRQRP